jgi:four helix bundle protein
MDLVEAVYAVAREWPRDEQYGLTGQTRRAAISIPSNLAEGHGRSGRKEYAHHVSIAFGSLCELETQLLIANRLGYLGNHDRDPILERVAEIRRIMLGLLRSLKSSIDSSAPESLVSRSPSPPERSGTP